MNTNLLELLLTKIIFIFIFIYGFFIILARKRLKELKKEIKDREEIINKIVKINSEMEIYREVLLTKPIPELNKLYKKFNKK
ncbi:MAG: hypothetical protein ACRC7H_11500 [Plesiomonas shigelloides]